MNPTPTLEELQTELGILEEALAETRKLANDRASRGYHLQSVQTNVILGRATTSELEVARASQESRSRPCCASRCSSRPSARPVSGSTTPNTVPASSTSRTSRRRSRRPMTRTRRSRPTRWNCSANCSGWTRNTVASGVAHGALATPAGPVSAGTEFARLTGVARRPQRLLDGTGVSMSNDHTQHCTKPAKYLSEHAKSNFEKMPEKIAGVLNRAPPSVRESLGYRTIWPSISTTLVVGWLPSRRRITALRRLPKTLRTTVDKLRTEELTAGLMAAHGPRTTRTTRHTRDYVEAALEGANGNGSDSHYPRCQFGGLRPHQKATGPSSPPR